MTLDRPARGLRLLVVAPTVPRADASGGDLRLFALLGLMVRRHRVTFYPCFEPDSPGDRDRHASRLRGLGVRVLDPGWKPGLERALLGRIFDAVAFEFWEMAELGASIVRRRQPWARVIVDSVDLHFRREALGLAVGAPGLDAPGVAARKARELAAYRSADAVACVSAEDGLMLEAEGGIPPRPTLPLIVPSRARPELNRPPSLLFVGGFKHQPNVDGLLGFARESWPSIRSAVPGATLTVVGSHPTPAIEALSALDGIEVVGYVPDLGPYLDRASAMVAPLRYGAGMKSKVVEAMASGLAVVTTTVGAQGLGASEGEHLLIADDPADFARAVVALLRDPARAGAIGRRARDHIAGICGPEAVATTLEAALSSIVGAGGPKLPPLGWSIAASRHQARRAARFVLQGAKPREALAR